MTVDQYSQCMCGSGKKIKFCKCAPHLQEMSKVARMMEGEQMVAALDRVNVLLKSQPSEAWLLATKCRILLRLEEFEQLEETSAKFIRLQPDNSLAKILRSIVAAERGNYEESANMVFQAIADSNGAMDSLYVSCHLRLIYSLWNSGNPLSAMMHAHVMSDLVEDQLPMLRELMDSFVTNGRVPCLLREEIPSKPDEPDDEWSERFVEAMTLYANYRVGQAKSKLEGILREFGARPAILNALLQCNLLLNDQQGAAQQAIKLSQDGSLPHAQRIYFLALSMRLGPEYTRVAIPASVFAYSIDDEAALIDKVSQQPGVLRSPVAEKDQRSMTALFKQEVPPRAMFEIEQTIESTEGEIVRFIAGWMVVFGKQTDQPARLGMVELSGSPSTPRYRELMEQLGLQDAPRTSFVEGSESFFHILPESCRLRVGDDKFINLESASRSLRKAVLTHFLRTSLPCFEGRTIIEAASDPRNHLAIQAIFLNLLDQNLLWLNVSIVREYIGELGIEFPKLDGNRDILDEVSAAAYYWLDLENIDPEHLLVFVQSALTRRLYSTFDGLLEACRRQQWDEANQPKADFLVSKLELHLASDLNLALDACQRVYESGRKIGVPSGAVGVQLFNLYLALQRSEDAMSFLPRLVQENPGDPHVTEMVHAWMERVQSQRQVGTQVEPLERALAHHSASKRTSSSSELWTPESSSVPVSGSSSNSSGSKLWVPGMD